MESIFNPGLSQEQTQMFKMYYLVSFWLEANMYGVYIYLFAVALNVMLRRQALDTTASRVFLTGIILMFVMITFQNSVNVYRLLSAYGVYDPAFPDRAVTLLLDMQKWDAYAFPIVIAILTWIGDVLVASIRRVKVLFFERTDMIYRCWIIWQRNYYIILLPVLLLLTSIATSAVNFWWFRHPSSLPWFVMNGMLKLTFPLNFIQNVLTTSFIAFRLYKRHLKLRKMGLKQSPNSLNVMGIMRIIVESALIWTVEMALLIVLWCINHPGIVIVQHASAPSLGIVFVLIAIRTHVTKNGVHSTGLGSHTVNAFVPTWLDSREEDLPNPDDLERNATRGSRHMHFLTSTLDHVESINDCDHYERHELEEVPRAPFDLKATSFEEFPVDGHRIATLKRMGAEDGDRLSSGSPEKESKQRFAVIAS